MCHLLYSATGDVVKVVHNYNNHDCVCESSPHLCMCRLEATGIPKDAQDRLAEIVEKLKADPDRKKLDVNYLHHAQVIEKRNQTNVT